MAITPLFDASRLPFRHRGGRLTGVWIHESYFSSDADVRRA
jgi:hypothetical protein